MEWSSENTRTSHTATDFIMALLTILITLIVLPIALIAWTAQSLAQNCAKAKASGLPYIVRWISPINPFWLLYGSSFVRLCSRLGIATENLTRVYSYGWEANERAKIHMDYGDAFMVVHPGGVQLCVSNAKTIYEILRRRTDFRRNMEEMAVLNVYGKNLSTTDDQEWQQHRKMTGVTFTEKNNEVVWEQSIRQGNGMLRYWTERAKQPIRSTHEDTKIFTLNVEKKSEHADDTSYQYRESLSIILSSIIQIFIFGEEGLKAWWTPKSWKSAATAMSTFRSYIVGLMNEKRSLVAQGKNDNQHLVARLVQACEEDQPADDPTSSKGSSSRKITLTEEEIISNLFVYAFAGNDTTAIALTNLLVHLAANPETQEWIAEEINYYIPTDSAIPWNYENFSKLKRCGAVVMETLRICHPLSQLVKTTNLTRQSLKVGSVVYNIPAGTSVHCSLPALHTHPLYWGSNALAWDPRRFISTSSSESTLSPKFRKNPFEAEILAPDTSENFMPFAWGQRVCPGKLFAQVELVGVLAVLFKEWRVKPEPKDGETQDQARDRVWKNSLVVDHEGHMLHEMLNPKDVGLRWVKSNAVEVAN
ncbi:cytochrome P450 monooxygenase-like protein [Tricladium varicosporioides]|nr:cytochrome P450 monooxygenase-like protein [Hymenoscyphus varicosporioides]